MERISPHVFASHKDVGITARGNRLSNIHFYFVKGLKKGQLYFCTIFFKKVVQFLAVLKMEKGNQTSSLFRIFLENAHNN